MFALFCDGFVFLSLEKYFRIRLDKKIFCCRMTFCKLTVRLFSGVDLYFGLFFAVDNLFISYLLFFIIFKHLEYTIKNSKYFLINNLLITFEEMSLS